MRARVVRCSEVEAKLMGLTYERDAERDEAKKAALLVTINAVHEGILQSPPKPPHACRRPRRSTVSLPVQQVARAAGVSERALQRLHRQRCESEASAEELAELLPVDPTIIDIGMPLAAELKHKAAALQARLTACLDAARRIQRELAKVRAESLPVDATALSALESGAALTVQQLERSWPASLCPYCKALPALIDTCGACVGLGVLGRHVLEYVPDKLWDREDQWVMRGSEFIRVSDAQPKEADARREVQ
jgi:hypothetical protein